jgi:cytochrome oxidase Cu insertion factor (SCO1/SenC/PrrC family)
MRSRLLLASLAVLALISAGVAALLVTRADDQPAAAAVTSHGTALVGGPFTLTDHTGARVSDADFRGRWMLVFFGYTYCPDVCPLDLQVMVEARELLPAAEAAKLAPIFITVDPERDTVEQLASYVTLFDPALIGLTGSRAEIDAAIRAYRVYARKAEGGAAGDGYLVDHSAFTYLMGPDGAYVTHFGHGTTPEQMAARLKELLA